MAIVRTLTNGNKVTDWTEEVLEIDNQYGLINGMGLFRSQGTSQESVIFEKEYKSNSLIPQTSRRGKPHTKGQDRQADMFSLALPYFSTSEYITPSDIQGQRKIGTPDAAQDLASAIAIKMEDMRVNIDQTKEYMKLKAIQGITIDPDGNEIANMFSEFGLTKTDFEMDWALSDASTDVDQLIVSLKRALAKNAKTGGKIGGFHVLCSTEFFDALVSHPRIREAYAQYAVANNNSDVIRGNQQVFADYGVVDTFMHKGITFVTYDCDFNMPDGSLEVGITASKAHVLVDGVRDLYRAYHGPSNTLSGANSVGQETFMYQWTDPKDKFIEMEAEMSPLYVCMKPQLCVELTAT